MLLLLTPVLLTGCSATKSQSTSGTSVVVLIDFSKSFVPLSGDERALREVSAATTELAQRDWQPPVSVLWSRIQTASLVSQPLCGPFEYQQSLIKKENDDSTQLAQKLQTCTESTVRASTVPLEQAPYTDISGALELATDQGQSVTGQKYLIVISDFVEDLPPSMRPVKLQLHGERVLLLHRTGTDRTQTALLDHLARVQNWSERLRQAGAQSVVALPLSSITRLRVMRALGTGEKAGTDVVVLQDLPDTARPQILKTIATTLNKAVRDWSSPVTITWADIRDSSASPWQMPPLEFTPRLIKPASSTSTTDDFPLLMNEYAEGMQRFSPGAKTGDMAASLKFYSAAGATDANHIFFVISSFPDPLKAEDGLALDLAGVRLVMLPAPNLGDAADESGYTKRIARWEAWLKRRNASVCRLSLNGLTSSSLLGCEYGH
jgi:hypothetical protein